MMPDIKLSKAKCHTCGQKVCFTDGNPKELIHHMLGCRGEAITKNNISYNQKKKSCMKISDKLKKQEKFTFGEKRKEKKKIVTLQDCCKEVPLKNKKSSAPSIKDTCKSKKSKTNTSKYKSSPIVCQPVSEINLGDYTSPLKLRIRCTKPKTVEIINKNEDKNKTTKHQKCSSKEVTTKVSKEKKCNSSSSSLNSDDKYKIEEKNNENIKNKTTKHKKCSSKEVTTKVSKEKHCNSLSSSLNSDDKCKIEDKNNENIKNKTTKHKKYSSKEPTTKVSKEKHFSSVSSSLNSDDGCKKDCSEKNDNLVKNVTINPSKSCQVNKKSSHPILVDKSTVCNKTVNFTNNYDDIEKGKETTAKYSPCNLVKRKGTKEMYKTTVETWSTGCGNLNCPRCNRKVIPLVRKQKNKIAFTSVGASLLLTCWPFCFLIPMMHNCSVDLYCPCCKYKLGVYNSSTGRTVCRKKSAE